MTQQTMWMHRRRRLAALAVSLLLGATAACNSGGSSGADDDPSPSETTSSDATETSDATSSATASTTVDPTKEGGYAPLPDCAEFAESVIPGEQVTEGDSTDGKICRFSIGPEDEPVGVQLAFIVRGGGEWPKKFDAKELNQILAEAGDDDRDWVSKTEKVKAPGFTYGVRFHQTLGKAERTQLRLFTFAKNGDLLQCYTNAPEKHLKSFQSWCGDVLAAIQP